MTMITSIGVRRPHLHNQAKDPLSRALIDAIHFSRRTDTAIARDVNLSHNHISRWRKGEHSPRAVLVCWVLEAINCKFDIVPLDGGPLLSLNEIRAATGREGATP